MLSHEKACQLGRPKRAGTSYRQGVRVCVCACVGLLASTHVQISRSAQWTSLFSCAERRRQINKPDDDGEFSIPGKVARRACREAAKHVCEEVGGSDSPLLDQMGTQGGGHPEGTEAKRRRRSMLGALQPGGHFGTVTMEATACSYFTPARCVAVSRSSNGASMRTGEPP